MTIKKCDLCRKEFIGHGHQPHPLKGKICCDNCHYKKVIPARFALHKAHSESRQIN